MKRDMSEYHTWRCMRGRCKNPKSRLFSAYGGRGIYVCERWNDFDMFYADMGPRPSSSHSLDRIDNDGPYSPENCRWATHYQQSNNRRSSVLLTFRGKTQSIRQWSRETGINHSTIQRRLKRLKWSVEKALTTSAIPPKLRGQNQQVFKNAKLFTYKNRTMCIAAWAVELGISKAQMGVRFRNWSVEEAITRPLRILSTR